MKPAIGKYSFDPAALYLSRPLEPEYQLDSLLLCAAGALVRQTYRQSQGQLEKPLLMTCLHVIRACSGCGLMRSTRPRKIVAGDYWNHGQFHTQKVIKCLAAHNG